MKVVDRLVTGELVGPWGFGVAMFSVLVVASSFLFRMTEYFVQGVPVAVVIEMMLLLMPSVFVKTFAMSMLLAALLAFGRLSSDSEIVALRASGVSVARMMVPVGGFSLIVAVIAFWMNETMVPAAALRTVTLQEGVTRQLKVTSFQPISQPIMGEGGKMLGQVTAQNFSLHTRSMEGATIVAYGTTMMPSFVMWAKNLEFEPSEFESGGGWRIKGGATILPFDGSSIIRLEGDAWPPFMPKITSSPADLAINNIKNPDAFSMRQIRERIENLQANPRANPGVIANLEYWYWNKVTLPLAALIYGLLGAPLGITNHRTGAATGFALSIAIIFGYITLGNMMNIYAMGGRIPAYVASFTPLVLGLICAGVIMWRRNA